ncbi:Os07g0593650 [Oryza sativa Japonica Group]|nr:Os07g0593650 [Oryza sativa Japonica Group]
MQAMATGMAGVDESHNCADVGGDDGCDCGGREPRLRMQATARRRGPQGDEGDGGRRQPQGDEDDDATMPVEPDEGSWST